MNDKTRFDSNEIDQWIERMSQDVREKLGPEYNSAKMLGIRTGGVLVAEQLHRKLALAHPAGELNISFYRDDFSRIGLHPQVGASDIPFPIDDEVIILVDDVLYSGRTIRAAMNEIFDFGRPTRILLVTLIERTGRELPISADVIGHCMELGPQQNVKLREDLSLEIEAR